MPPASRKASSGASATWCWASAAGCARSTVRCDNPHFAWQVLCLRLAVIKCHARGAVDNKALRLNRDGDTARLEFSDTWIENHPRTLHLLREEADNWARQGPLRLKLPR